MIAEFREKYFELLEENKKHRREIHRLNKELLNKNELLLAYQEVVDTGMGRQEFAEQLGQERAETKKWQQAHYQMSEKCEQLESQNTLYQQLLRMHNIKFEESASNDAPQEQEVKLIKSLDARHYISTTGWD
ncbi:MAG: hypothetical protein F4219_02000 [Gammaproteobacteria bacterium]|nr:hypothetical protein [Gammaproteobacteria bacterium]